MSMRSGCLAADKPWLLRYGIAVTAIIGFGGFAFSLGHSAVGFRCQALFFALLFAAILLPLFEIWWRDCAAPPTH